MTKRFKRNVIIVSTIHVAVIVTVIVFSVQSCRRRPRPPEITNYIDVAVSLPDPPEPETKTVPDPEPIPPEPEKIPEPPKKKKKRKPIEKSTRIIKREPDRKPALTEEEIRKALANTVKKPTKSTTQPVQDHAWYYAMIRDQLYKVWRQPGSLSKTDGIVTRVVVRVNRSGKVLSKKLLAPSGNEIMDQSVMQAVNSVSSLPQLPRSIPDNTLDITIDFELTGN